MATCRKEDESNAMVEPIIRAVWNTMQIVAGAFTRMGYEALYTQNQPAKGFRVEG